MGFAPFINRAATAASQVLKGFDLEAFRSILLAHTVCIAFDGGAAESAEGKATLDMTVRLLARLYPVLAIVPLDIAASPLAPRLGSLARSINPQISITKLPKRATICIVVGEAKPSLDVETFFAGSDGWIAKFSLSWPVGSGQTDNPFGAGAAACIAAANVFRAIFGGQMYDASRDSDVALSIYDYVPQSVRSADFSPCNVDIGESYIFGLGAIGNSAIWALSRLSALKGTLHVVDNELLDLSNLQRYVLPTFFEVNRPKSSVAKKSFLELTSA